MAVPLRATIVAQYPLPGGGKVALTIMADSMNGEQYAMLAQVINQVVPLAESLGWKPNLEEPAPAKQRPARPPRPKPTAPSEPAPAAIKYPALSAVPHAQEPVHVESENGGP